MAVYKTKTFRFQKLEWQFIGLWLQLGIVVLVFGALLYLLESISNEHSWIETYFTAIKFILSLFFIYVFSRLSLVLPACAIENKNVNILKAWKLSNGNGWRLAVLVGFIPLILDELVGFIPNPNFMLYIVLKIIIWLFVVLFELGLLSMSYAFLMRNITDD